MDEQREVSHESEELPDHPEDPFPPPAEPPGDEDAEDFVDDENEEDDEATMDEEEALLDDDEDDDELDDLEAEADMDIEELRKKYGYGAPAAAPEDEEGEEEEEPSVSTAAETVDQHPEAVSPEAIEKATDSYFGVGAGEPEEEEVDVDYEPPEKKEFQIRVDPVLYQAVVPETMEDGDRSEEHEASVLLWSPSDGLSSSALNRFVHEWKARRAGMEEDESMIDWRDDEDALFALLSAAYSTADAAAAAAASTTDVDAAAPETAAAPAAAAANECKRTVIGEVKKWSDEEKAAFETGFKDNYKNFRLIREAFVPTRTLGELIQYYYQWKKTARFNEFRRGHVHAPRKDFMTEVMDQMDGNKRRREAAEKSEAATAAELALSTPSTTVIQSENDDDEVEYEEPPADVWASVQPLQQQQEQPTESA